MDVPNEGQLRNVYTGGETFGVPSDGNIFFQRFLKKGRSYTAKMWPRQTKTADCYATVIEGKSLLYGVIQMFYFDRQRNEFFLILRPYEVSSMFATTRNSLLTCPLDLLTIIDTYVVPSRIYRRLDRLSDACSVHPISKLYGHWVLITVDDVSYGIDLMWKRHHQ